MKLTLDLEQMLDTMSKGQILKQVETEIDKVVAKRIEAEDRANRAYQRARERVNLGEYDIADLETLKAHLNKKIGDEFEQKMNKELNLKTTTTQSKVKAIPVAIKDEEIADILKSLFGEGSIIY